MFFSINMCGSLGGGWIVDGLFLPNGGLGGRSVGIRLYSLQEVREGMVSRQVGALQIAGDDGVLAEDDFCRGGLELRVKGRPSSEQSPW